jgi:UDPglucose 6-dehydrogenase
MKTGIIGLGFVGNAIQQSFNIFNINTIIFDKYKNIGNFDQCLHTDLLFLALPTLFNDETEEFDKSEIIQTCTLLHNNNYKGLVILKSTVEPETTKKLSNQFKNLKILHNPEFLTAKTAVHDFHNQKHIIIGKGPNCTNNDVQFLHDFFKNYYTDAHITICTSDESESTKLFLNSFYATKVQFFTELYLLCNKNNTNFNNIKNIMLKNNWINPMHTNVPGPDGNISYGGLCFPKDTKALNSYMKKYNSNNKVLQSSIDERDNLRND